MLQLAWEAFSAPCAVFQSVRAADEETSPVLFIVGTKCFAFILTQVTDIASSVCSDTRLAFTLETFLWGAQVPSGHL